jgi:N-acetylmuramoyl-L-alanine amidase
MVTSKHTYIIDAGHGGVNPRTGAYTTAPRKMCMHKDFIFYEGEFNRAIAAKLERILSDNNFNFIKVYHEWKDTSLKDRVEIANQVKRGIYFSIHGNAAASSAAHGFEAFTSPGQTKSDMIAGQLYFQASKHLPELRQRKDYTDKDPDKEANFYVLKKTRCPAVLGEFGFFTNYDEAKLMLTDDFQERAARCIFETFKWCELYI